MVHNLAAADIAMTLYLGVIMWGGARCNFVLWKWRRLNHVG
jgi:hypothetical protein